ncbi:hypothetical protein [Oceanisphaera profunda]|uniref:hypothetical protein n=1 Tax=Oceanisphaera profunda TaxID=1416627 RepID=UPI0013747514|nr:hypothetical protein [Oceanisphaera profunda]
MLHQNLLRRFSALKARDYRQATALLHYVDIGVVIWWSYLVYWNELVHGMALRG